MADSFAIFKINKKSTSDYKKVGTANLGLLPHTNLQKTYLQLKHIYNFSDKYISDVILSQVICTIIFLRALFGVDF